MNNKWKWVLGLALATIAFIISPFAWGFFISYGMMRNTNEWFMPMMYGAPGMMAFGMMLFKWLILLAMLVLIGLGIAWLVKELSAQKYP
jgi:hypothetical protein